MLGQENNFGGANRKHPLARPFETGLGAIGHLYITADPSRFALSRDCAALHLVRAARRGFSSLRWVANPRSSGRFRFYRKHRARRLSDYLLGDASENEAPESFPPVGRHHDQIGAEPFCRLQDLDGGIARSGMNFVASISADFLAGQVFKLGSGFGLHFLEGQGNLRAGGYCDYMKNLERRFVFLRQLGSYPERQG